MGTTAPLDDLRSAVRGSVHGPGDAGYDAARAPWNTHDQRPAAVVEAADVDDVSAAVTLAGRAGLRVAAQATGHGARSSFEDAILVRTDALDTIEIDADQKRARIGAGAQWGPVQAAAAAHGLAGLAGTAPHLSAAAYTLGGGFGWLGRAHGLCSGSLRAAEVVLADGARARADAEADADLLWALRGGGGNFGLVTQVELDLVEAPEVFAGVAMFPLERCRELLGAWRDWTAGVPDAVSSALTLLRLPPAPFIPEEFRGKELVVVGACHADGVAGEGDLAPIRGLDPFMDTFAPMPPTGLWALHNDPEDPLPEIGGAAMLAELPDAALDAIDEHSGPASGSPLLFTELRHAGGALGRPTASGGAMDHLEGAYLLHALGVPLGPPPEAIHGAVTGIRTAVAPWTAPGIYLNFTHHEKEAATAHGSEVRERLLAVKRRVDPEGRITSSHPLEAASG